MKKEMSFGEWCTENRWTTTKLAREFDKYGCTVSPSAVWYWQKGIYSPRDERTRKILSLICGFNSETFTNFKK